MWKLIPKQVKGFTYPRSQILKMAYLGYEADLLLGTKQTLYKYSYRMFLNE
jgi:hypothetical protein